jgi:hypothetical protein
MSRPRAWAKAFELKHSPPEWFSAWEPLPANDETQPDPEGDAYWLDAPNAEDISYLEARRMHG